MFGGLLCRFEWTLQATSTAMTVSPEKPSAIDKGVGEVWVDTQFELSEERADWFPGTMTVLSATSWNLTKRKIALPDQKMNNGHNFWPSHDQKQIYQTEWQGIASM